MKRIRLLLIQFQIREFLSIERELLSGIKNFLLLLNHRCPHKLSTSFNRSNSFIPITALVMAVDLDGLFMEELDNISIIERYAISLAELKLSLVPLMVLSQIAVIVTGFAESLNFARFVVFVVLFGQPIVRLTLFVL